MCFSEKLRNEVGTGCANRRWWAGFGNGGWRYGETLGVIIFAFIIVFVVILHAKYLVNRHYINERL